MSMVRKKKVVFEDAGENKVAVGGTKDFGDFLEVTNDNGDTIVINKRYIVFIKDINGDY